LYFFFSLPQKSFIYIYISIFLELWKAQKTQITYIKECWIDFCWLRLVSHQDWGIFFDKPQVFFEIFFHLGPLRDFKTLITNRDPQIFHWQVSNGADKYFRVWISFLNSIPKAKKLLVWKLILRPHISSNNIRIYLRFLAYSRLSWERKIVSSAYWRQVQPLSIMWGIKPPSSPLSWAFLIKQAKPSRATLKRMGRRDYLV
jgi:hypothetical protein